MITGDHPLTALSIAKDINIAENKQQVATGLEVEKMFNKGQKEFDEFGLNIIREADRLGYDTGLYKPSPENQKFSSIGELIRLTEKAYEDEKITGGKRREILLKSFRHDILYGSNEGDGRG